MVANNLIQGTMVHHDFVLSIRYELGFPTLASSTLPYRLDKSAKSGVMAKWLPRVDHCISPVTFITASNRSWFILFLCQALNFYCEFNRIAMQQSDQRLSLNLSCPISLFELFICK